MMYWIKNKNLGGGYLYEFMNCIEGMYTVAKFNRLAKTDKERALNDSVIRDYLKKLDNFELPFSVKNDILMMAYDDLTPGLPTAIINKLLRDYEECLS